MVAAVVIIVNAFVVLADDVVVAADGGHYGCCSCCGSGFYSVFDCHSYCFSILLEAVTLKSGAWAMRLFHLT